MSGYEVMQGEEFPGEFMMDREPRGSLLGRSTVLSQMNQIICYYLIQQVRMMYFIQAVLETGDWRQRVDRAAWEKWSYILSPVLERRGLLFDYACAEIEWLRNQEPHESKCEPTGVDMVWVSGMRFRC